LFYIKNASIGLDLLIMVPDHQDCLAEPGRAMKIVFWIAAATIGYAYVGYCGLAVAAQIGGTPRPIRSGTWNRAVSAVMVVGMKKQ